MRAHNAVCNPAEVAHLEREWTSNPNNLGVGVIDKRMGQVRLFTYDETDAFCQANRHLQVGAGHEAAAAMAGIPSDQARGFILMKRGNNRHIINQSYLNKVDGQIPNMQMDPRTFNEIVFALRTAGVQNPVIH